MATLGYTNKMSLALNFTIFFSASAVLIRTFTSFKSGGLKSVLQANRFYGAMIIHIGLVIIAFGIVMSSFYMFKGEYSVKPDFVLDYKGYTFQVGSYSNLQEKNYISEFVPIKIYKGDELITTAYPEMRTYNRRSDEVFREVSYYSLFTGDLYFALYTINPDDSSMVILFIHQPFVSWIWAGCVIMVIWCILWCFYIQKKGKRHSR